MRDKARRAVVLAAALLVSAESVRAMYTPNPAGRWEPQRFFLAGDFQFNASKDLDFDHDGTHTLNDTAGFFVRPSYSVARNVAVYARLGFQEAGNLEDAGGGVNAGFAGGFGVQGAYVLPQAPDWAIGGSIDYMHWSGDVEHGGPDIDWNEFQLAPAVSYRIPQLRQLTPYAGLLFDFVDAKHSSQSDPVGLLFGTNFDPTPHVRLDAQFRVVNETGFLLSAGYLF